MTTDLSADGETLEQGTSPIAHGLKVEGIISIVGVHAFFVLATAGALLITARREALRLTRWTDETRLGEMALICHFALLTVVARPFAVALRGREG